MKLQLISCESKIYHREVGRGKAGVFALLLMPVTLFSNTSVSMRLCFCIVMPTRIVSLFKEKGKIIMELCSASSTLTHKIKQIFPPSLHNKPLRIVLVSI